MRENGTVCPFWRLFPCFLVFLIPLGGLKGQMVKLGSETLKRLQNKGKCNNHKLGKKGRKQQKDKWFQFHGAALPPAKSLPPASNFFILAACQHEQLHECGDMCPDASLPV